ncbi:MAG: hypothetical protein RLZZ562_2716 [Planctomycetota bacterium]|jgi:hypothetical protein
MPVLLYLDLLGAPQRWHGQQPGEAQALFDDFADLVLDTIGSLDVAESISGDIEGDWAALVCPSIESALALSRRIFRRAWLDPRTSDEMRLWMRGVIAPSDDETARHFAQDEELPKIRRATSTHSAMRALTALRSGVTGMRILVDESLLNDQLRGLFRVPLGRLGFIPFRRMNFTPYTATLPRNWQDFLWMADTQAEWANYTLRMKQRIMWSAHHPAEAAEAAATQALFHEVDAIVQSVVRKNMMREDRPMPRRDFDADGPQREAQAEGSAEA